MNRAIEFSSDCYPFLTITPRKKTIYNQLLRVEAGSLFIKLGKSEYVVEEKQALWIPQDCLTSLTILPNTQVSTVAFSLRLLDQFPHQAGHVTLTPLCEAVLVRLTEVNCDNIRADLLQVVRHEVKNLSPQLLQSELGQQISDWHKDGPALDQSLDMILKVREARKMALSGAKEQQISDALFAGDNDIYHSLRRSLLGETV